MRNKIKIVIALIFIPFLILNCGSKSEDKSVNAGTGDSKSGVKWYSFNQGIALAKKNKKQLIIDFYADWCKWCKVMEETTFKDPTVINELSKNFIAVRIYTDKPDTEKINFRGHSFSSQEFSAALGVEGLPTVIFMDEDGNLITKVPGFVDKTILLPVLGYMTKKCYKQKINISDYVQGKTPCDEK